MINWKLVSNFKRHEFDDPDHPGSGDMIDGVLLLALEGLRKDTGWPIITHWQVGGCVDVNGTHGHADGSYHLKKMGCKAIDFHFDCNASPRLQYYFVSKHGFTGVGVYLNLWWWNNNILPIAFHVDHRPKTLTQRWSCREKGKYLYLL